MKYLFIMLVSMFYCEIVIAQQHDIRKAEKDSLAFLYDVRTMTVLLNDTAVHYSVIFNPETNLRREGFVRIGAAFSSQEAVKHYGEKYRDGIVIYRREGELKDDK